MPALATVAIVGGAYLALLALCKAASDGDRATYDAHRAHARERAARMQHPTARRCLRLVHSQPSRPFDWERDA